ALRQSVRNRAGVLAAAARIPAWQDAAVRELAQDDKSPLYILSGYATRLDDIASGQLIDSIDSLTGLAEAIANRINSAAPAPTDTSNKGSQALVEAIAGDLQNARRPLVVCGSSNGSLALLNAATNVARALAQSESRTQAIDFACLVPEVNSIGLALMTPQGNTLGKALDRMQSAEIESAVIVETDLYRHSEAGNVDSAIEAVQQLIVLDQLVTPTTRKADLVLGCTSFPEQKATYVNYEGRAQLGMQVYISGHDCLPAWSWLQGQEKAKFDSLARECESSVEGFQGLCGVLPDKSRYLPGMKVPRQSHRYSGRTAMNAGLNVHEGKQPQDTESVMAFSMEGESALVDSAVMASSWAPQWNSNQSVSKFQDEVGGELKQGNPGIKLITKNKKAGGYQQLTSPQKLPEGAFSIVEAFQIFGSDELSNYAEPIQQRLTHSYAAISPVDATALQLQNNDSLELKLNGAATEFPVCIREKVKPGTVVVFNGGPGFLNLSGSTQLQRGKSAIAGTGRFDNLIVSDLFEEGD
ncbi:MAG: molybdopterin-dependent oxidoreductase, partial [Gammaproteobacteria bacterium]|nr:molybdopterin-dependent oxidoreductase [Gammaproteobacteria bacterium]